MIEYSLILFTSIIGGWTTFVCSEKLHLGALKASSLLSLIVAIPFELIEFYPQFQLIPIIFFGASFVGMASIKLFNGLSIFLASIIFGLLYILTSPHFDSIGGCLGTTACISCLIVYGLNELLQKRSQS